MELSSVVKNVDTHTNEIINIYQCLLKEFIKSKEICLLELERNKQNELIINFLHYDDSYKTNNKLIQIFEVYPESFERLKNYIVEVLRSNRKIKKGA
ncbi:hypothetical protein [Staphylococcus haemolyticus]|uniref:hypothetical protein n=1 Tax=Staphylococcus haemolyticus TaxID=1283 RepID=UPI00051D5481|nr:hypothetical protein [Staphylococcus haemolyticus]KGJ25354.1 hypothetical protein ES24_09720 [Staphylococcus haemolyticus]KGJ29260.1 hypothetical protein ES23_05785 [Staphylococcus haemolyticus]MCH4326192.1 hypothetical protein [Staphylococcus haemolyticus]MCH4414283.1 hypothetical protein [Staphylococcus haemolyticus]MCH4419093.1 hypothetical protein [Staphylococcus haemolyticus]